MALPHAKPLDVIDVAPLRAKFPGSASTSLLKTGSIQVLRLVLPAGAAIPEHSVAGAVTVHCLEGEAIVGTRTRLCELKAGQLVMLEGGERHDVKALTDASLLVTIVASGRD